MRKRVGNRQAKAALERLPRRAHLGPAWEGGVLYAGTPYVTVEEIFPGIKVVVRRTEKLCSPNTVGQIGVLRKNQLTRIERCAMKRLMKARQASAKMRADEKYNDRMRLREELLDV